MMYNLVVLLHGPGRGSGWRNNGVSCTCRTRTRGRGRTAAACAIEIKSGSLGCRCQCTRCVHGVHSFWFPTLFSTNWLHSVAGPSQPPETMARRGRVVGGLSGRLLLGGGWRIVWVRGRACACAGFFSFVARRCSMLRRAHIVSISTARVCIDERCYAKAMRIKCGRVCVSGL